MATKPTTGTDIVNAAIAKIRTEDARLEAAEVPINKQRQGPDSLRFINPLPTENPLLTRNPVEVAPEPSPMNRVLHLLKYTFHTFPAIDIDEVHRGRS